MLTALQPLVATSRKTFFGKPKCNLVKAVQHLSELVQIFHRFKNDKSFIFSLKSHDNYRFEIVGICANGEFIYTPPPFHRRKKNKDESTVVKRARASNFKSRAVADQFAAYYNEEKLSTDPRFDNWLMVGFEGSDRITLKDLFPQPMRGALKEVNRSLYPTDIYRLFSEPPERRVYGRKKPNSESDEDNDDRESGDEGNPVDRAIPDDSDESDDFVQDPNLKSKPHRPEPKRKTSTKSLRPASDDSDDSGSATPSRSKKLRTFATPRKPHKNSTTYDGSDDDTETPRQTHKPSSSSSSSSNITHRNNHHNHEEDAKAQHAYANTSSDQDNDVNFLEDGVCEDGYDDEESQTIAPDLNAGEMHYDEADVSNDASSIILQHVFE